MSDPSPPQTDGTAGEAPNARRTAAIIGGGSGGLMAAEVLATAGMAVTVFDHMASVGRKLLLAGRGGLNLTHSERLDDLLDRYGDARPRLEPAIRSFDPDRLRAWSASLGEDTFVGTSGRVFPASLRATPLLRAWLRRLAWLEVDLRARHAWTGWTDTGDLRFTAPDGGELLVAPDVTLLALGGASWPRVGSDGHWTQALVARGIQVNPLRAANSGFLTPWTAVFRDQFAGEPLKNISLSIGSASVRGEAMVTRSGLEGGAIYALGRPIRDAIEADGRATVTFDLQADLDVDEVAARIGKRRDRDSTSTALKRTLGLSPVAIGLLREATGNEIPRKRTALAALVKAVPITLIGSAPIDRAISTTGGVDLDEVDDDFMLRRLPGTYAIGEMLDWDAPTGGYLLQATFSTAVAAARAALRRLD